jgi:4-hydroxy-tetrahydrodipicolinate synthase
MRRQVEVCIGRGVAGIVTLGLATDVAGRVPLGVTIFEPTVGEQVGAAKHAAEHGADWIILQPIPDARNENELIASFSEALSRLEVPCAIQNAPQYIGVGPGNDSILRLCDRFPHLVAIKQEVSAVETATLIEQLGGRLQVFSGPGGIELHDCMTAGIHGHVPAPECVDRLVEKWALQSRGRRE